MHFKFKPRFTLSVLASFLFCFFILPITERIAFTIPSDKQGFFTAYSLKLLFFIFLIFVIYFSLTFVSKLREKKPFYIFWAKCSSIYLALMIIMLALVYPGNWLWDEFVILHEVKIYSLYAWQNYFTNIFYTFCLYLIPSAISIILIQLVFISIVVGYVISKARLLLHGHTKLAICLFIPFLTIPVLYYNLYPLRLTLYSYIEILVIIKLLFLHLRPSDIHNKYTEMVIFTVLITLVAFWRSEGIYFLLLLPYIAIKLNLLQFRSKRNLLPYGWIALCLLIISVGVYITRSTSNPKYELSVTLNPLSTMIQHKLKGDNIDQKLADIDKVLELDVLKAKPSYTETPALWEGGVQDDYYLHMSEYNKAALYIIVHNPDLFIQNRAKTFLAANTLDKTIPQINNGGIDFFKPSMQARPLIQEFQQEPLIGTISKDVKVNTTRALLAIDSNDKNSLVSHAVWNIIPIVILLAVFTAWHLFRRSFIWMLLGFLVLIRFTLIFLTAPGGYFMYYLPVYMSGLLLITLPLLLYTNSRLKSKATQ